MGGERQGAHPDHRAADFDRQLPLSGTELFERGGNGNQLPNTDFDVDGLGNAVRVELLEVGYRREGRAVVVEAEDLVVGLAGEGASVGAVLAQPDRVPETAAAQYHEARVVAFNVAAFSAAFRAAFRAAVRVDLGERW